MYNTGNKKVKDELLILRDKFPILKNSTYLISNSLGAMPKSVYNRMQEYAETWANLGVKAWQEKWWQLSMETGNLIAPLIGAGKDEITMHPNVSLIQSIIVSSFNFNTKKNKVVYTDLEFPSDMYVYQKFAKSKGAEIQIIKSEDGFIPPTEKLLEAIDEKTLLVPISHVLFRNANIMNIKSIVKKAHSVGALVVLDAYHSVGTLEIDVNVLDVDILMGGVLKWLCGGPGGAFLWVKPELREKLEPEVTGWLAHKNPFAFENEMEYTNSAYRFMNGTPTIPSFYAAQEGTKIISQIGMDKIRKKSIHQTEKIIKLAEEYGYKINTPKEPELRGGTVSIDMSNALEISNQLLSKNIMIDYRPSAGIRIAPHFYNTDEEIDILFDAIIEITKEEKF
ncbi:MAG: kynureninase [Ignavibacteriales bacterium CG_4_9_14_3_um_filter_30_11]|nr:MAG: kynureninase [Ignavibacteriales bacterium CG_4_9_14_3_um_filter_30_11]